MTILVFGDIMGKIGRKAVAAVLPGLKKKYKPDIVIANAENLAHGVGVTEGTLRETLDTGINLLTSGNHIWSKKEVRGIFNNPAYKNVLLRPSNYPPNLPGDGEAIVKVGAQNILVINLCGRVFFKENLDCPFRKLDEILFRHKSKKLAAVLIDFHAEATSEKTALGWYANGRVSALWGTHTHIPTADKCILNQGTAYITDIGMVGAKDSVIGEKKENIINMFLTQVPFQHEIAEEGTAVVNAILLKIDPKTRKTKKIEQILLETNI